MYATNSSGNIGTIATTSATISTRPIVINEIGWAGTSATQANDEWIELKNTTEKTITLSNWILYSTTDTDPYIALSGSIAPNGYFVLERTDDTTISDQTAGQIYTGSLANTGEQLSLSYASTTIDQTPATGACPDPWCGGDTISYKSMERFDPYASGDAASNWGSFQGFLANGKNADTVDIQGTPGRRNSMNYLINKTGSFGGNGQNLTLTTARSPYIVTNQFLVGAGSTLTIDPGTIIKFYNASSGLTIEGLIKAQGTSAQKIIFTSFKDDMYGSDTNADATTTTPTPGDWRAIRVTADGSIFDYTITRYAGIEDNANAYSANIHI